MGALLRDVARRAEDGRDLVHAELLLPQEDIGRAALLRHGCQDSVDDFEHPTRKRPILASWYGSGRCQRRRCPEPPGGGGRSGRDRGTRSGRSPTPTAGQARRRCTKRARDEAAGARTSLQPVSGGDASAAPALVMMWLTIAHSWFDRSTQQDTRGDFESEASALSPRRDVSATARRSMTCVRPAPARRRRRRARQRRTIQGSPS